MNIYLLPTWLFAWLSLIKAQRLLDNSPWLSSISWLFKCEEKKFAFVLENLDSPVGNNIFPILFASIELLSIELAWGLLSAKYEWLGFSLLPEEFNFEVNLRTLWFERPDHLMISFESHNSLFYYICNWKLCWKLRSLFNFIYGKIALHLLGLNILCFDVFELIFEKLVSLFLHV